MSDDKKTPFDDAVTIPTSKLERIEMYAYDLAWGYEQGWWNTGLLGFIPLRGVHNDLITRFPWCSDSEPNNRYIKFGDNVVHLNLSTVWTENLRGNVTAIALPYLTDSSSEDHFNQFTKKWHDLDLLPTFRDLEIHGYVTIKSKSLNLTDKALQLLSKPFNQPNVFISYRREASSMLALAIEARLKLVGNHNIRIDKNLIGGDDWAKRLEAWIEESRYFVLLMNRDWKSEWMLKEVKMAYERGKTIITILHPNISKEDEADLFKTDFVDLKMYQYIRVCEASASGYEAAINALLNTLGYATY